MTMRLLLGLLLTMMSIVTSLDFARAGAPNPPLALVYAGPGTCQERCAEAAAEVAQRAGLRVRLVSSADIKVSVLRQARVWIQPGGDAIEVSKAIPDDKKELLRQFIRQGGGYLGFCAGAFFTDSTVDNANTIPGLGIIPGTTHDYKTQEKAAVLPISWHGRVRHLYFEEGGYFELANGAPALILGTYSTGEPASIASKYGAGNVVVSGPHPEALPEWFEDHNLNDPDGPDLDLADEMLKLALPSQPWQR